ncbi:unnamed protein product, partial [Discosporangium mesarthrocarpum]
MGSEREMDGTDIVSEVVEERVKRARLNTVRMGILLPDGPLIITTVTRRFPRVNQGLPWGALLYAHDFFAWWYAMILVATPIGGMSDLALIDSEANWILHESRGHTAHPPLTHTTLSVEPRC